MKLGHSLAVILTVGFGSVVFSAHSAFQKAPLIDTATIDRWMASEATAPKTVEAYLDRLPGAYRGHFVLMYESRSLHRATPSHPRIIFYGPDARLLTAVSTDPQDPRRNVVELIEFDPNQARFNFHEITFGGGSPQVNHAPKKCQNCHGADLRPNWEPYDAWPGAYGSVHDKMAFGTFENSLFRNFMAQYKGESRFLSLPEHFGMKHETFGGDPTYYTISRGGGMNSAFSLVASFANRERITRMILQSPKHSLYRKAIAAALIGCPDEPQKFLPAGVVMNHPRSYSAILEETQNLIQRDHRRRVDRTAELQKVEDRETFENDIDRYGLREKEVARTARLRYLLENRREGAVSMNDWSLALHRDSYNFNDGVSGLENLIGHYVPLAFSAGDPVKAKLKYKTILYDVTSYGELPGPSGAPDAFALELYEAAESTPELCGELESP